MALDDIPNKLQRSLELHGTCPLQLHQAFLHPKHWVNKEKVNVFFIEKKEKGKNVQTYKYKGERRKGEQVKNMTSKIEI